MKLSYDKDADALALIFKNDQIVKDKEISENIFADFSKDGELVEIQVLDISESDRPWLTVSMVAKYFNKSERTILRWIESSKILSKKVGKEYHIDSKILEEAN